MVLKSVDRVCREINEISKEMNLSAANKFKNKKKINRNLSNCLILW